MNDVKYVTQEMWDRAQEALKAVLPFVERHTPPLSTAGTMVSLRALVSGAIHGGSPQDKLVPCWCPYCGEPHGVDRHDLPPGLRDPVKAFERGRELLAADDSAVNGGAERGS